jgi:hypothetical protein
MIHVAGSGTSSGGGGGGHSGSFFGSQGGVGGTTDGTMIPGISNGGMKGGSHSVTAGGKTTVGSDGITGGVF